MAGNASRLKMGHYPLPEAEARKMAAEEEDTLEAALIHGRHHLKWAWAPAACCQPTQRNCELLRDDFPAHLALVSSDVPGRAKLVFIFRQSVLCSSAQGGLL